MEKSVTRYDTYSTRNMLHPMRVLIISAALAVAACSSSEPAPAREITSQRASTAPAPAPASTRPRIVFLGDSLTAGLGLDAEQSVPSLVQRHLDAEGYRYEVVNAGVSGDTSAGGLRRLEWSLDGDVRILVVELGANDGLRGLPVAQMKQNLQTILQTAKKRSIDVLLTGMEAPPNYGAAYTSEFRRAFRDLAAQERVAFMPFFLYEVAGIPTLNIADGIHPNPAGARIVEANLWRSLKPLVEKQAR
jgi:Lysophospholipase L1 and related esterases